jgi:hypothetical protein
MYVKIVEYWSRRVSLRNGVKGYEYVDVRVYKNKMMNDVSEIGMWNGIDRYEFNEEYGIVEMYDRMDKMIGRCFEIKGSKVVRMYVRGDDNE